MCRFPHSVFIHQVSVAQTEIDLNLRPRLGDKICTNMQAVLAHICMLHRTKNPEVNIACHALKYYPCFSNAIKEYVIYYDTINQFMQIN